MKKKQANKLRLSVESLRVLENLEIPKVRGGFEEQSMDQSCRTGRNCCLEAI